MACHLIKHVAILRLNMANVLAHLGDFLETVDIGVVCCASFPPNKVFDATAVVLDGKADPTRTKTCVDQHHETD